VNVLALDTATPSTVVGLLAGAKLYQERDDPRPGERPRHAQLALALADRALRHAGLDWREVERLGVGTGPGSFTGLRIGVASARALAQSAGLPLVGVSTLRVLAASALASGEAVLAVLDARRDEAFVAAYRGSPRAPEEVAAPAAVGPSALARLAGGLGGAVRWWAVGDGAIRFRGDLEPAGVVVAPDDSPLHRVDGGALCRLAATASPQAWDAVAPQYLRDPDAELALRTSRP
jgi:tRNA threonylcarbamoyladenosine biosynthesis protein TsaB